MKKEQEIHLSPYRKSLDEKVDELVESVSGWKSHLLVHVGIAGGINALNLVLNNIALFEILPRFLCTNSTDELAFECTEAEFCGRSDV
jgi:MFS family permease